MRTVKAICLNALDWKEADKLLILLTAENGKIVSRIRAVKNPKSKLKAGAAPNCYAEYTLHEQGGTSIVTGVEVIEQFFGTWTDPVKNLAAAVVTEALERVTAEGVAADSEFAIGLRALFGINYGEGIPYVYLLRFLTELLSETGIDKDEYILPRHIKSLINAVMNAGEDELGCLDYSPSEVVAAVQWTGRLFRVAGEELKTLELLKQ